MYTGMSIFSYYIIVYRYLTHTGDTKFIKMSNQKEWLSIYIVHTMFNLYIAYKFQGEGQNNISFIFIHYLYYYIISTVPI